MLHSGGGWTFDEATSTVRNNTALGSSRGYNYTGNWDPPDATTHAGGPIGWWGPPGAQGCMGQDSNCTRVLFPYCDSSSFTSNRELPYQVPGGGQFVFKGRANLENTLDVLAMRFQLGDARRVVVSGGSAGALSTYLHVDRIAEKVKQLAPDTATLQVVAAPNAGYFIDVTPAQVSPVPPEVAAIGNYPPGANYSAQIKYGMAMFNSTPTLSPTCKVAQRPGEEWRCFLAPVVFPFIKQPTFVIQSRFDEYQLVANYRLPCERGQSFKPPYKPTNCGSAANRSAIVKFGATFMPQFEPVLRSPGTGCFLVSCIQHGVNALIDNTSITDAFASWLTGGQLGKPRGYKYVDDCGSSKDGSSPCNAGANCAPY